MPGLHISKKYKSKYFLTLTALNWIDIFTNEYYYQVLADSLNFCTRNKGLIINGYVFMINHLHLLLDTQTGINLGDIIRDFKRHTTREIKKLIKKDNRKYLKWSIKNSYKKKKKNTFQIWKPSNWPIFVESPEFYNQKLEYIHNNPVMKGYVDDPVYWKYSSACDYFTNKKSPVCVSVE